MSLCNLLIKAKINKCLLHLSTTTSSIVIRQGHVMRGKPPGVARTLEQRLNEENVKDPEVEARVNIGFPKLRTSRSEQMKKRLELMKTRHNDTQLEKLARSNKLLIDLEQVQKEYQSTTGQYDLRVYADHYGIFTDLFGRAYFVPRVALNIKYEVAADTFAPVYYGNIIKPAEAAKVPIVDFAGTIDPITGEKSKNDSYWTLLATNPDGHFTSNDAEYVHWFVANIPNGDVSKGDTLVSYLPPFPPRGLGYQRFVFVLYKQNKKLDFSTYKIDKNDATKLEKRTFKTIDFYRKYQDDITPAGLCFYQTDWDKSLTKFYHDVLNIKEPIFEYDFPAAYLSDQKEFPLKQPFNLYMDKHRDIKQVNKEYLERKLKKTHPFDGPEKPLRFPNAHAIKGVPSWLKTEIKKQRLRIGRINDY